jgi:hypothetical protein
LQTISKKPFILIIEIKRYEALKGGKEIDEKIRLKDFF